MGERVVTSAANVEPSTRAAEQEPQRDSWLDRYRWGVTITDFVVIAAAVFIGQGLRYGFGRGLTDIPPGFHLPVYAVTIAFIVGWLLALRIAGASDRQVLAAGPTEFNRVIAACFAFFGFCAILAISFKLMVPRGLFAIVFPLGTLVLLGSRLLWRRAIDRRRSEGRCMHSVLVVGDQASTCSLVERLAGSPELGYRVVGVCTPNLIDSKEIEAHLACSALGRFPVYTGLEALGDAVRETGADAVAVAGTGVLHESSVRELAWTLDAEDVELLIAPGLAGISGPRITVRPEAGLPLLHVEGPQHAQANRANKVVFDKVMASLALLAVSPLMMLIALAVKLDSRGPVFYRGERVGADLEPFPMWKFRTMVDGADRMRSELATQDEGNGVLFKIRDDPRVTRVGRFLRRYSLDELPQLFNVVRGEMSMVGPRPPLREEVERYEGPVIRRMLVRPGMTGMWQVSGRSDLSWDDSVQLDLLYVENWSMAGDLMILAQTARAVLAKDGAY